jgi:hypothetical protein
MKKGKKGLVMLSVCLCILVGMLLCQTTAAFAADKNVVVVQGFEGYGNDTEMKKGIEVWKDGGILELSLSTSIKNEGNQSLKMIPKGPNGSQPWASITVPVEKGKNNWTGADEIQLYVKNVGTTYLSFQVNIYEAGGEAWALKSTGTASIATTAPGKYQEVKCDYNVITVPAGFAGLVKIPFTSFEVASWYTGDAKNDKLDLMDISTINFGFSATDNKDKSIYVDTFSIAGTGLEAEAATDAATGTTGDTGSDTKTDNAGENPKTGDVTTVAYLVLGGLSGCGIVALGRKRK